MLLGKHTLRVIEYDKNQSYNAINKKMSTQESNIRIKVMA